MSYGYSTFNRMLNTLVKLTAVISLMFFSSQILAESWMTEEQEIAHAKNVVGPIKSDDNCENCHVQEVKAWKETRHFATFKDQHKSKEAKKIVKALKDAKKLNGRSMKSSAECRQCHYTSIFQKHKTDVTKDKIKAKYGVSCESCHGPAREWSPLHSKVAGNVKGEDLKWGQGKNESTEQRAIRLGAAQAKGMIHSDMIYNIAKNCFGCHTVPNETVVNTGGHHSGSDFELVSWSQGEIRHNFSSSAGAPETPTNAPSSPEKQRRLYVTGLMVDLETSLENISHVTNKGGVFHKAMITRANKTKTKLAQLMSKVAIAELKPALNALPAVINESTDTSAFAKSLGQATLSFLSAHDGSKLAAIDVLIPTETKGTPHNGE